jgi:hypothetical protein
MIHKSRKYSNNNNKNNENEPAKNLNDTLVPISFSHHRNKTKQNKMATAVVITANNKTTFLLYGVAASIQIVPSIAVDTLIMPIDRITTLRQVAAMREHAIKQSSQSRSTYFDSVGKKSLFELLELTTEENGFLGHFCGWSCISLRTVTATLAQLFLTPKIFSYLTRDMLSAGKPTTVTHAGFHAINWSALALKSCIELVNTLVAHPFEYIRTRMIVSDASLSLEEREDLKTLEKNAANKSTVYYANILDSVRKIYYQEGLSSFFSGLDISLLSVIPSTALFFYLDHRFKVLRSEFGVINSSLPQPWLDLLIGLFSRGIVSFTFYPFEVIKHRMYMNGLTSWQLSENDEDTVKQTPQYRNSLDCAYKIITTEGIGSLYSGLSTYLLRLIPRAFLGKVIFDIAKYQVQIFLNAATRSFQQQQSSSY